MKTKKIISFLLVVSIIANILPFSSAAITPRWTNTRSVRLAHIYNAGTAECSILISAYEGASKIDNVDIKLYKLTSSSNGELVEEWNNLSVTGNEFNFYDEVEGVQSGYTYRLAFTAEVHRNGTVEELDLYDDKRY